MRGVQGGDLLGRAGTRVVLAAVAELRAQLVARAREGEAQLVPAPAAASTRAGAAGGHLAAPATCTWRRVHSPRHRSGRAAERCTEANNNVRPSVAVNTRLLYLHQDCAAIYVPAASPPPLRCYHVINTDRHIKYSTNWEGWAFIISIFLYIDVLSCLT